MVHSGYKKYCITRSRIVLVVEEIKFDKITHPNREKRDFSSILRFLETIKKIIADIDLTLARAIGRPLLYTRIKFETDR